MVDKLVKDGQVAVLVSHGYGAGWYSWESDEAMLFDPVLAEMLDSSHTTTYTYEAFRERLEVVARSRYPNAYIGGVSGLCVHWVPEGVRFRIEEYDGAESLHLESDYRWITA